MTTPNPPFRWGRLAFWSTAIIGTGYLLLKVIVPSEQELYNRMAPDLQRDVDRRRAARLAVERGAQTKDAHQTDQMRREMMDPNPQKPIWTRDSK